MTSLPIDRAILEGERVRLRPGVRRVRRAGALLLLPPEGNPVMVSPLVDELWASLSRGVMVSDLAMELRTHRPRAGDIAPKLTAFLERLWTAGLLEGSVPAADTARPIVRIPIDPVARAIAWPARLLPRGAGVVLTILAAAAALTGMGALFVSGRHPHLTQVVDHFTLAGAAAIVLVVIPLHELGHAIACRLTGVASGPLAVRLGKFGVPRPYVDTARAWGVADARYRAMIPIGGPLMDLWIGGAAAWLIVAIDPPGVVGSVAWLVSLYAVIAVNVGTSPIFTGDGSHFVEALLDDDFARGAALLRRPNPFVRPHSVAIYRAISVAHVVLTTCLFFIIR